MRFRKERTLHRTPQPRVMPGRGGARGIDRAFVHATFLLFLVGFSAGCLQRDASLVPQRVTSPLQTPSPKVLDTPEPAARVAIIIDDVGHNQRALPDALALTLPVDFAVLPHVPHSAGLAEELSRAGFEIMLHQPMEPVSETMDPGPGSISARMSRQSVELTLTKNLQQLPMAAGVNNHMGSKATASRELMEIVLSSLAERGLFFVDSLTTSRSVCGQVAKELGIPIAVRDVFLDNLLTREYVAAQLEKLRRLALKKGEAIAIGHFHPLTLRTLDEMAPSFREDGIEFVFVSELIHRRRERTDAGNTEVAEMEDTSLSQTGLRPQRSPR